jgi:galactokinase
MTADIDRDALVEALVAAYPGAAGPDVEVRVVRAPGRVNLIGEHTDYNEGFVMPAAIDLEIRIAYVQTDDGRVELRRLDAGEQDGFDLDAPRPKASTWLDYVVGTAWALDEAGLRLTGLRGVIASTLPPNAGLSSSAAIELASAWAMLGDSASTVDRFHLAKICQRAENGYVGVQSGLMDQFAESCGQKDSALFLDCRSGEWRTIPLPDDVAIVVCHTGSPRHLGASEYNLRRSQCESAVAAMRRLDPTVESLRDVTPELLAGAADRLSDVDRARAEHVVTENERVGKTVAALEAGDLEAVGRLFAESHASLRDRFDVSSPELDAMVAIATSVPGVVAARMTGAGFGGCTVNLVRPDAVARLREAVEDRYPQMTGLRPMVFPVNATDGAGRLS